jgi:putative redox protein
MSETVKVSVEDSILTGITIRGHEIRADEPPDKGGEDRGPSPGELFLGSLAACTAMTLRMYANVKEWPLEGVDIEASQERVKEGDRDFPRITMKLNVRGNLDEDQVERLKYIARRCPVHRTVTENPEVVHEF